MKLHYIEQLIAQGEHQLLDFKYEIADAMKIARTFVAFANTKGGILLIGIRDNGDIVGIRSAEEKYMAGIAANYFCRPIINFTSKEWNINRKIVLEINIPKGEKTPYKAKTPENKWRTFIRVADENIMVDRIIERAMIRKRSSKGTYISFTKSEKYLLEYLEKNESISLPEFGAQSAISKSQAETILVNFLALDLLEVAFSDCEPRYKLAEKFRQIE